MGAREGGKGVTIIESVIQLNPITTAGVGSPSAGMVIYNSSTNKLNVYTGSGWEAVTSA